MTIFHFGNPPLGFPPVATDARLAPKEHTHVDAVFAVLSRFFQELEAGRADKLMPSFGYVWQFYKPPMTVERMRNGLAKVDVYWAEQMSYVNGQRKHPQEEYTAAPDLSRLPDLAVVALFQELDHLYATHGYKVPRTPEEMGC